MEAPYSLKLGGDLTVQTVQNSPYPEKPLRYARPEIIGHEKATFLRQLFVGSSMFIELCSCRVTGPTAMIIVSAERPALLFCYLLKGEGVTLKQNGKTLTALLNSRYAVIYLPAGEYGLRFSKGRHLIMNFAFSPSFLKSLTNSCPHLSNLLHSLQSNSNRPEAAQPCKMDDKIKQLITKMRSIRTSGRLTEATLMSPVAELLWRYEFWLQEGEHKTYKSGREKAWDAKEYIEENYTRPDCQVNHIAVHLNSTRKTLSREFKKAFGTGTKEYILQLRMKLASKLLEEGHPVNEVTTIVGYDNPFSFSRMFKNHYGYPPSQKKRQ